MKIKKLVPLTYDQAVLATQKKHFREPCYDRKLDELQYFWAVLDGGDNDDEIVLLERDEDGYVAICDRSLVVEKINCPICGQKMFPKYDPDHIPSSWQDCLGCGYMLDTSTTAADTIDSHVQALMKGNGQISGWKPASQSVEGS